MEVITLRQRKEYRSPTVRTEQIELGVRGQVEYEPHSFEPCSEGMLQNWGCDWHEPLGS